MRLAHIDKNIGAVATTDQFFLVTTRKMAHVGGHVGTGNRPFSNILANDGPRHGLDMISAARQSSNNKLKRITRGRRLEGHIDIDGITVQIIGHRRGCAVIAWVGEGEAVVAARDNTFPKLT